MNRIVLTFIGRLISYWSYWYERVCARLRSVLWKLRIESIQGEVGSGFWVKRGVSFDLGRQSRCLIGRNVVFGEYVRIYVGENGRLSIGDNVFIGSGTFIVANQKVIIGEGTQIAHSVTIIDTDHEYRNPTISLVTQGERRSSIEIGKNVWIATQSVVLRGRKIGDHSVVGAHTVVTQDIPPVTILAGKKEIPFR